MATYSLLCSCRFVLFCFVQTSSLWVNLFIFRFTASECCVMLQKAIPTPLISIKLLTFNLALLEFNEENNLK